MKTKSILLIFIMPLLFILLASCEKESVISNNDDSNQSINYQLKTQPQLRVFYNQATGAYCEDLGGNCLPDVIVRPQAHITAFNDVFDAVNEGTGEDVIDEFDENETILEYYLREITIGYVIDGTYTVEAADHISEDDTRFLIFKDEGNIVEVSPIVCEE